MPSLIGYNSDEPIGPGDQSYFGKRGRTVKKTSDAYAPKTAQERLGGLIDTSLEKYGTEAERLRAEEERRGATAERTIMDAAAKADVPTVTDAEIRRRFSTEAAASTRDRRENLRSFREFAGQSGAYGGGQTSVAATQLELSRLASMTRARSDLATFKMTSDALDRQKAFDRSQVVAGAQDRPVSLIGADYAAQELQTRIAQLGAQTEIDAAKAGASAAKSAGKNNLIGSAIGAVGGLIGSII